MLLTDKENYGKLREGFKLEIRQAGRAGRQRGLNLVDYALIIAILFDSIKRKKKREKAKRTRSYDGKVTKTRCQLLQFSTFPVHISPPSLSYPSRPR